MTAGGSMDGVALPFKSSSLILACFLLVLVGSADYLLGHELGLSFFYLYLAPVAFAAWNDSGDAHEEKRP